MLSRVPVPKPVTVDAQVMTEDCRKAITVAVQTEIQDQSNSEFEEELLDATSDAGRTDSKIVEKVKEEEILGELNIKQESFG